jgi:hypothetical protein
MIVTPSNISGGRCLSNQLERFFLYSILPSTFQSMKALIHPVILSAPDPMLYFEKIRFQKSRTSALSGSSKLRMKRFRTEVRSSAKRVVSSP